MFRRSGPADVSILFDGCPVPARTGESVAAALIAAGVHTTRRSAVDGSARGAFCMMGACFECAAVVDGVAGVQLCMVPVRDGLRVETAP